jgi:uncharacterized membrane protein
MSNFLSFIRYKCLLSDTTANISIHPEVEDNGKVSYGMCVFFTFFPLFWFLVLSFVHLCHALIGAISAKMICVYITGIILMMTGIFFLLYRVNWYIFKIYSSVTSTENVYYLHRVHFKETTLSYLTIYILHWCILAVYSCMVHSEVVYCLHESRHVKLIDSIHSFYNGVWLCESLML